jgi:hypothetical protein
VTCVSASECWAVGYYYNGSTGSYQTFTERWGGTSWAVVTSPNPTVTSGSALFGVTCTSGSDCWAVGFSILPVVGNQTLIERWDGTSWTIVTSPNTLPVVDNFLQGVTCASSSDCWAVGYSTVGVANQTLVERWDGNSWAIVTSPNAGVAQNNFLQAVTCASAADCWAVGYSTASSSQTLVERWDGNSWAIVTSPNTSATQNNFLQAITCASPTDCRTTGYYYTGSANQTLIEQWDGTSWTITVSPNIGATHNNVLSGVTCASTSDCWAVGYYNDASGYAQTLTERFAPPPVPLVSVASRKTHGGVGIFDLDLPPTGNPGIECRSGGVNGDYTVVVFFC